jgi:membrane-bound metal-dependent hydrolase YbcI (DUF457 family)
MLAEHLVYTAAVAVIAGMLFLRYTGRDTSWIIILASYAPDLDTVANRVLDRAGFTVLLEGHIIEHGTFHNVAAMIIFAVVIAFLLHPIGIRFRDSFLFTITGFGAHLFEDALVFPSGYMYLWPFSPEKYGLGWLPLSGGYSADFFHIANAEVLFTGLVLLFIAILIRTRFEGTGWIRWYMPEKMYQRLFTDDGS